MAPLQLLPSGALSLDERQEALSKLNPIETQVPGTSTRELSVFESLPSIQEWVDTRGRDKTLTYVHAVLELVKKNPQWLNAVIEELRYVVPIGKMSRPIWELSIAVVQCLTKPGSDHAGKLAVDLMSRILMEEDCSRFKVTSILYTLVMRAAPDSAEEFFRILVKRHKQNSLRCKPSVSNRVALIVAMAKTGQCHRAVRLLWTDAPVSLFNVLITSFESPKDADKLLSKMEDHLRQQKGTNPNLRSFRIVLRKWVDVDAGRAQGVLERVFSWATSFPNLHPTEGFFVDVMRAHINNVERVEELMKRLEKHIKSMPMNMRSKHGYQLSPAAFETCMTAWAKKGQPERVEQILTDMGGKSVKPSKLCWGLVAKSWTAAGNTERAESVIRRAGVSANAGLCNIVLHGWSQRDVIQAEAYFDRMCQQARHMQPDTNSYQILFTGWRNNQSKQAGNHVKNLLQRMEKHAREGKVHPTDKIYELALSVLDRAKHKIAVLKLRRQTEELQKKDASTPLLTSESFKLATPSRSGNGLAEDIFKRMEQEQVTPTTASFNCVNTTFPQTGKTDVLPKARPLLKRLEQENVPDVVSCNSVLAVCLSGASPRASEISRSMISHMMREYESGNDQMLPRPSSFTRLFTKLYAERSNIQAKTSVALVNGMKFPDEKFALACFTYALTVCSLSRDIDAPTYADHLWQKLKNPSLECFNLLLKTFANHPRHKASQKAEAVLHANGSRSDWKPTSVSLNLVVEAVAKSRRTDAAQQAFSLLQRFNSQISGSASLSLVLMACAMVPSSDKGERLHTFNLAVRAFTNWQEGGGVINSLHYHRLLTCAIRLAPTSQARITMAKGIFDNCLAAGLVDKYIFRRFWGLAPLKVREDLLGRDVPEPSVTDLPSEWTCRVSSRKS
jgi:uncharacterized protein (UPF0335 family)